MTTAFKAVHESPTFRPQCRHFWLMLDSFNMHATWKEKCFAILLLPAGKTAAHQKNASSRDNPWSHRVSSVTIIAFMIWSSAHVHMERSRSWHDGLYLQNIGQMNEPSLSYILNGWSMTWQFNLESLLLICLWLTFMEIVGDDVGKRFKQAAIWRQPFPHFLVNAWMPFRFWWVICDLKLWILEAQLS